jgi:hypothetical protein
MRVFVNLLVILVVSCGFLAFLDLANYWFGAPYTYFEEKTLDLGYWIRNLFLLIAMLAGIIAGHIHERLADDRAGAKVLPAELKQILFEKSLWRSLLASPILFVIAYSIAGKQPDFLVASLLAFENGFFCNVILSQRRKASTQSASG